MKFYRIIFASALLALQSVLPVPAAAEDDVPGVKPVMTVTNPKGEEDSSGAYDGEAPAKAVFTANPENVGDYDVRYEWIFLKTETQDTLFVRYEENTAYDFNESGSFMVILKVTFDNGTLVYEYDDLTPFTLKISESVLNVPNAFTPNGDGYNDVFKVKDDYKSIISFEATVFNRYGRKLFSWNDLEGGWDGTFNGSNVPDGAYYLYIKAKGADGKNYDIKKTINLLRGYIKDGNQ